MDILLDLIEEANRIYNNVDLSWEVRYDLIFSDNISKKIGSIIHFDYYDPDTSYEEDVTAYILALNNYIKS